MMTRRHLDALIGANSDGVLSIFSGMDGGSMACNFNQQLFQLDLAQR